MDYRLTKKVDNQWKTYGNISSKTWDDGNTTHQVSFKLSNLQELVDLTIREGKEWVNLSLFENSEEKPKQRISSTTGGDFKKLDDLNDPIDDLDQEIPF